MKTKRILFLLPILAGLAIAGMTPPPPPPVPQGTVDIDLTAMNRTMVYSQVFDMMQSPGPYRGKTVRMKGTYATTVPQGPTNRYHACFISDAMACCAQGIEFVPTNAVSYPADFPSDGAPIVVQGVFDTYVEDGNRFAHVRDALLLFRRLPGAAPAAGATNAPPARTAAP